MPAAGRRGGEKGDKQVVPPAELTSYYGLPVVKETVWGPAIPSYLFLGGLAGASSVLAAGAQLSGYPELARAAKAGAAGAISLSMAALVHDLGRPARFVNMLRVFKVTSPMSVGTWVLSGYTPLALAAAASALTGNLPRAGLAATLGAACSVRPSRRTRPSCSVTPPRRAGTRPTASCPTCSPARPPPRPAASASSLSRRGPPRPRPGWPSSGPRPS